MNLHDKNEQAFRNHDRHLTSGPPEWEEPTPPKFSEYDDVKTIDGRIGCVYEISGSESNGYFYLVHFEHPTDSGLDVDEMLAEDNLLKVS